MNFFARLAAAIVAFLVLQNGGFAANASQSRAPNAATAQLATIPTTTIAPTATPPDKAEPATPRWLMEQAASPFEVPAQRLGDSAPPISWNSSDVLGQRSVVLIFAPHAQSASECGCYGPVSPVPPLNVLEQLNKSAAQLAPLQTDVLLVLPNRESQSQTQALFERKHRADTGTGQSGMTTALRLAVDENNTLSLVSGIKLTKPALVVLDRAGFVRHAETMTDWDATNSALSSMGDPTPRLEIGQAAPSFAVRDMNGTLRRLDDYQGRNLLLTFFPKCFTGHCTNHLTSLQAVWHDLVSSKTDVLAVSVDPAEGERGQLTFAKSLNLSFPLVPDTERNLCILYGASTRPQQLAERMSVLIDRDGIVRWIEKQVVVKRHGLDVVAKIQELGLNPKEETNPTTNTPLANAVPLDSTATYIPSKMAP